MPNYHRLTQEQRYTIEALKRNGHPQKDIAQTIGVNASTISRELNRDGMNPQSYCHQRGQRHANNQHRKTYQSPPELLLRVEAKIREEQWSPQQISETFRRKGLGKISHETIYQHVYRDQKSGGDLHKHLRHKIKSYRKRGLGRERRGRLKNQVMIDKRPQIVETRSRIGDWEMDTVIGKPGGEVLVTMVERKSRYTLIARAPSKEALAVGAAIIRAMNPHKDKVLTTTYDNGKEFAEHELLGNILEAQAYFAYPYRSWERGLNENTNGLIRQYFPKGSALEDLSEEALRVIQRKLNTRPRKQLEYQTPNDIFKPISPIALAA